MLELPTPTTVIGRERRHVHHGNGPHVSLICCMTERQARWLDVAAGEFLTVRQLSSRNPGVHPLYGNPRRASLEEMEQINRCLTSHGLDQLELETVEVGDELITERLVAHIPVKEPI